MQAFFCKLVPPHSTFLQDVTAAKAAAMGRHAGYWKTRIDKGVRVFALGVVADPAAAFGVGIVEVEDTATVQVPTADHPAITAGMGMRYEIYPMPRGVMHI